MYLYALSSRPSLFVCAAAALKAEQNNTELYCHVYLYVYV